MKILFVQKMNGISGSELYLMQIMPELKKRGYDIEMLIVYPDAVNTNQRFIEHLAQYKIKIHEIYGNNSISPLLFFKIHKLLKRQNYDLIQTNLIHADFWLAVLKALFHRKLKIISVSHGYDPAYQAKHGYELKYLKYYIFYWIQKFSLNIIDFNVTISEGLYNVFEKGGLTKKTKLKTIYYGLTLNAPIENHDSKMIGNDQFLLIIGRLINVKGHRYLINAWKIVHVKYPLLKLYIVGDGELRSELEDMVLKANLQSSIVFWGHITNPHIFIDKCLFTLVTSTWEGFGLILLESWLHKKPIISFDGPAMNEIIDDNQNGLLVKMNNSAELAEKIFFLLQHPDIVKKYGENGYQKLTSYFTLKRMTDETEKVYQFVYDSK